jgi:hypothetical protein
MEVTDIGATGNLKLHTKPNYDHMFSVAKNLNPDWRTITLNVVRDASAPSTC